jgi:hypothetical protein
MWQPSQQFLEQFSNGIKFLEAQGVKSFERNFSGFPMLGRVWWEGEIQTDYGPITRENIISEMVERTNSCMDDYEGKADEYLRQQYEYWREYDEDEE